MRFRLLPHADSLRNLPQNQIVLKFLKRVVSGPFKKAVLKLQLGRQLFPMVALQRFACIVLALSIMSTGAGETAVMNPSVARGA